MNKTTLEELEEALERLEQIDGVYSWGHLLYEVRDELADAFADPGKPIDHIANASKAAVLSEREWVDLTDYEIVRLYAESPMCDSEMTDFARVVIAAFKEKNK